MKKIILGLLSIFFFQTGYSATGSWTTYTNMNTVLQLLSIADKMYAATSGGIVVVDTGNFSYSKMTNAQSLGGITINCLAYDSAGYIWFGSNNGKLSKYNLSDQSWKIYDFEDAGGQKMILNEIFVDGDQLWIASNLGVSLFLRDKNEGEIKETYKNFGTLVSPVEAQAVFLKSGQVWVGTSAGVAFANASDPNLLDPSRWVSINQSSGKGLTNHIINSIADWKDTLFLATQSGIFKFDDSDTSFSLSSLNGTMVRELKVKGTLFYAATNNGVYQYQDSVWVQIPNLNLSTTNLNSVEIDSSNNLWVGSTTEGLFKYLGANWQNLLIPGPLSNVFIDLALDSQGNLACANDVFGAAVLDVNNNWLNIDTLNTQFVTVGIDKQDNIWWGTWGKGAYKLTSAGTLSNYNHLNTPLKPVTGSNNFVVVSSITVDEEGNVWLANREASDGTVLLALQAGTSSSWTVFKKNEGFKSNVITYPSPVFAAGGHVWLGYIDQGLDDLTYNLTLSKADDFLVNYPSSQFNFAAVTTVALDKTGLVWIGTTSGLYKLDQDGFISGIPIAPLGLLVNSIAIDERNNKWVGTSSGLGVLDESENLSQILTTDNSPLADNYVNHVEINQKTSEIWIATRNGLSQYESGVVAAQSLSDIRPYPNPLVISGLGEKVTFDKLPFAAKIRIYNLAGELVASLNSTNQWNGRNDRGELVASGVYLFFVFDPNGKHHTGKIAVVRK
jgi:ligand-binding sensor domain-containing protein